MCTSIVSNGNKTIVGWNLDLGTLPCRVVAEKERVYIAVQDKTEGWLPLFGANSRGDFVAMPTCWPYDKRSDPVSEQDRSIILLNIDLLLGKRTLAETKRIAEQQRICSVRGITYQAQLSDREGNVLQITPGQGVRYLHRPNYAVMTNFSLFKGNSEQHALMGLDRFAAATAALQNSRAGFDVGDCFALLREASQTVCPTAVSMVFDVEQNTVYWCENMQWDTVHKFTMG